MILLDTNILSELIKTPPAAPVQAWVDRQSPDDIWVPSISVFEARFGFAIMSTGKRRTDLERRFEQMLRLLNQQVCDFDAAAAAAAAQLAASARAAGRTVDFRDLFIAAIAASQNALLATRNLRHFQGWGLNLLDPFTT